MHDYSNDTDGLVCYSRKLGKKQGDHLLSNQFCDQVSRIK